MKLGESLVCIECEDIVLDHVQECPSCLCTQFLHLASVLGQRVNTARKRRPIQPPSLKNWIKQNARVSRET
jgi:hypothetical protein